MWFSCFVWHCDYNSGEWMGFVTTIQDGDQLLWLQWWLAGASTHTGTRVGTSGSINTGNYQSWGGTQVQLGQSPGELCVDTSAISPSARFVSSLVLSFRSASVAICSCFLGCPRIFANLIRNSTNRHSFLEFVAKSGQIFIKTSQKKCKIQWRNWKKSEIH